MEVVISATASPVDQDSGTSRSSARPSAVSRSRIAYRMGWAAAQLFANARTRETSRETVMAANTSAICCSRRRLASTATGAESPSCSFPAPVSKKSAIWLKNTQLSSTAVMGSGWKSAALRAGTASIFHRSAAFRTAGSLVPAAIWSAVRSISPHIGPTSERILSRAWLAFTATLTSARLSTWGARMDTAQPTLDVARAIETARPTMADAA